MSNDLIKLLVDIEESAIKSKNHLLPTFSSRKYYSFTNSLPKSNEPKLSVKDKQERRALRSKITKILQTLPHRCEKKQQKDLSVKWYENKKKLYEINQKRNLKGKGPIKKLDTSSDEESCEYVCSPRELLIKNLTEAELALLNEDPHYFIPDKKMHKSKIESDWDELLKNDPKNPENTKKELVKKTQIEFLKGRESLKDLKSSKVKKNNFLKTAQIFKPESELTPTPLFHSSGSGITKPCTKSLPFRKQMEIEQKQDLKFAKSLPILEKNREKKKIKNFFVLEKKENNKGLEDFLKASTEFEFNLKNSIKSQAREVKLTKVKTQLKKWESKRKAIILS